MGEGEEQTFGSEVGGTDVFRLFMGGASTAVWGAVQRFDRDALVMSAKLEREATPPRSLFT